MEFQLATVPDEFFADPYTFYTSLREQSPFHPLPGGGIFLTRYADVAAIYRDPRQFRQAKGISAKVR